MELPTISTLLLTALTLFLLRVIYKYFVKPYILLQSLKKIKGAVCFYKPLAGLYPEYSHDINYHNDPFYSAKKRVKENPQMRFIATPVFDSITIELYDPELVKEFCSQMVRVFSKDQRVYSILPPLALNGIFMTEGEKWKGQRKVISQVFHFEYMNKCIPVVNRTCQEWLKLHCNSPRSEVNVSEHLKAYTASIVWQIFFGEGSVVPGGEAEKMMALNLKNLSDMTALVFSALNMLFGAKYFKLGLGSLERNYYRDTKTIVDYYNKTFASMKKRYLEEKKAGVQQNRPKNLVELLIDEIAKDNSDDKMKDDEIVSQVFTFLTAGTDTTSNLLAVCQYLLATNPDVQDKLRMEVKDCLGDAPEITYEHLAGMKYLDGVIKESLRCYGPVGFQVPRVALQDTKIGELEIKKGYSVYASLICMHNNPNNFANPDQFRPERWIEKRDPGLSEAFMPFSAGGRRCIGEQLAYVEAKIMICELVRRFKLNLKQPFQLKMGFGLIYEAKSPITMIYEKL